ncbi:MAG: glycosyltransferase [Chloroflexota bacterium]
MTAHLRTRRVVIVSRVRRNPYVALLAEGLRQPDLRLDVSVTETFSARWMWRHRQSVDVLHIHWLELLFVYPTWARSLRRWASVLVGLALARLSGVRLAYTVHNLDQHEGRRLALTRLANRVMFALAHVVHAHDAETAEQLGALWGRRRGVHIIPHGSYVGAYPDSTTREDARRQLGLAAADFVYLHLGRVRPYKGVEELVAAFAALPDATAALVIAGEAQEPAYADALRGQAERDARIRLHLRFVADDELQHFFRAADVCVLPYRHVTTSGAAILSFSFGVPVVAPRLGCFRELAREDQAEERRGLLYDPAAPDGLRAALAQARHAELAPMRAACARLARELSWERIARLHAAMYRSCLPGLRP